MGRQTYLAVAKSNSAADLHVLKMKDKHSVGDAPPSDVTDKAGATAVHSLTYLGGRGGTPPLSRFLEMEGKIIV